MDRQKKAEKAWSIPFYIKEAVGSFAIDSLASYSLEFYQNLFMEKDIHRFNRDIVEAFFSGVPYIKEDYDRNVSRI